LKVKVKLNFQQQRDLEFLG